MGVDPISPATVLAHFGASILESLTPAERLVLPYAYDLWLRPEQHVPPGAWRTLGFLCGRGWGKTLAIAQEVNRRVMAGAAPHVALMAPTEARTEEVQLRALIESSPPWFRPERWRGGLIWPNGVHAVAFTPEEPGRVRSENIALSWLCEIVDWSSEKRMKAYTNISLATRIGPHGGQLIWDTTSHGKNDVILALIRDHERDPIAHRIVRGTTFDNPALPRAYLRHACSLYPRHSRQYREEILGEVFAESAGALWQQSWLDDSRVESAPALDLTIVAVDPALSDHPDADETGIVIAGRDEREHVYLLRDRTARLKPAAWGEIVIDECARGAAGIVLERSRVGDFPIEVLRSCAASRGLRVEPLGRDRVFPRARLGVVYVREVIATASKSTRAGAPASETQAGRVHVVGTLAALEAELTTYEPGDRKSPNRLDAAAYAISELRGLMRDAAPAAPIEVAGLEKMREALRGIRVGRSL